MLRTPAGWLVACAALAAISLALPYTPLFDPWAWLVWGREITELELDTSAGPSWKPLAAMLAAMLAPFGDAAPDLWLLLARTAWLAVPVLVWQLAARLEGSGGVRAAAAGSIAAVCVLLVYDGFTSTVRQFTGGLSEPLLAALVVGAVLAALEDRSRLALALGLAACLLRPEAWPLAAAYAWRETRAGRVAPAWVAAGALAVPLLWFAPDLLAAGDALEGAERAREGSGSPPVEALEVLGRALVMPPALVWVGATAAVVGRRDASARVMAAGAAAWVALVALLAAAGYAGLPRFMLPAIAVACALGGAGLVRLARALAPSTPNVPHLMHSGVLREVRRGRAALVGVAAAACIAFAVDAGWRVAEVPGELERAHRDAEAVGELRALARERGDELTSCPPLATTDFQAQPPLAWELELPLSAVGVTSSYPHRGMVVVGPAADQGLRTVTRLAGERLTPEADWEAHRAGPCEPGTAPAARQPANGAFIAGVSGAMR